MSTISTGTCKKCRYSILSYGEMYKCRRNPPVVITITNCSVGTMEHSLDPATAFPDVGASEWCGEYKKGA